MARIAVVVVISALAFAAGSSAASPDVQAMNLQAADVPGAKIVNQRAVTESGYTAAHARTFVFTAPNKSSHLIELDSETALADSTAKVSADVASIEKPLHSPAGRKALVAAVARGAKVKVKIVALGQPHKVSGFDQGFEIAVSLPIKGRRAYENLIVLRLDRVLVEMVEIGTRPITITGKYAGAIARHIATELSPTGIAAPSVTGTAQQGQALTALPGTWTASDATFAYQWQHCDAAGANCADIAGATAQTYTVTPADVGATLHVVVKATNRFGSAAALSAPTAIVS